MDIRIIKQDGNFIDMTQDSTFTDYNPSSAANGQAVQVQDSGYFSTPFITMLETSGTGSINIWDSASSSWSYSNSHAEDQSFDYYGYNVIIKSGDNNSRVYFCKDDEMINLPSYNGAYVRVRLNSHIKYTNFSNFRTIYKGTDSSRLLIPLAVIATSSVDTYALIGLIKESNNKVSIGYFTGSKDTFTYATPNNPMASMARYVYYKDTSFEDLEQRVYDLELKVEELSSIVAKHEEILHDLPAIVSAVSSNVAKNYVAR